MRVAVNGERRVTELRVGAEGFPVLCIDDFSAAPDELVQLAMDAAFIDVGSVYPGVRAPAPEWYAQSLIESMSASIESVFGAPPEPEFELCAFSMVTASPESLRPIQRIPHFDGPQPDRIAWLHYLCEPSQGGTSFYRHVATGIDRVTSDRLPEYHAQLLIELTTAPSRGYASGESAYFERTHAVEAAFNRLIVYPGNALHSGDIGAGTVLSEDPRRGRLTINGFGFLRS